MFKLRMKIISWLAGKAEVAMNLNILPTGVLFTTDHVYMKGCVIKCAPLPNKEKV